MRGYDKGFYGNISPQTISMNVGTYNKQNNQIYLLHKLLFKNEGCVSLHIIQNLNGKLLKSKILENYQSCVIFGLILSSQNNIYLLLGCSGNVNIFVYNAKMDYFYPFKYLLQNSHYGFTSYKHTLYYASIKQEKLHLSIIDIGSLNAIDDFKLQFEEISRQENKFNSSSRREEYFLVPYDINNSSFKLPFKSYNIEEVSSKLSDVSYNLEPWNYRMYNKPSINLIDFEWNYSWRIFNSNQTINYTKLKIGDLRYPDDLSIVSNKSSVNLYFKGIPVTKPENTSIEYTFLLYSIIDNHMYPKHISIIC